VKEAVIALVLMITALWAMFHDDHGPLSKMEPGGKGWTGPKQIIIIPKGAVEYMSEDYYLLRFYYQPNLDWDVLGTLR
jgi:hypothetical protein